MALSSKWPRLLCTGVLVAAASAGVLALASGCSTVNVPAQPPKPCDVQTVTLDIYAADNINPNDQNNPRPVVVRLYQLKNEVRMENATYDEILLHDKDTLGEDIVKNDEVEVYPNDLVEVKFERSKEAATLAGVALFHSPKGQSWKTFFAFPLPPGEVACGGRGQDAGPPQADVKTAFFIESTKIDNGSQFDETMFPNVSPIRRINLPKASANSEKGGPQTPAGPPR